MIPKRKLTSKQIHDLSTPAERDAVARYKSVQDAAKLAQWIDETDLLILSEAVGIIVNRNKRLGII